eukprot:3290995-Pyramimonas_sp.AAC.1
MLTLCAAEVPNIVVRSLDDAARWCDHALERAASLNSKAAVLSTLTDRVITCSSSFSGVGTDATAMSIINHTVGHLLHAWGVTGVPTTFEHCYAVENYGPSVDELTHHPNPPMNVFRDILEFTEPRYRRLVGLDGGTVASMHELRSLLPYMQPRLRARCAKHGGWYSVKHTDYHHCSSPCVDWSNMGAHNYSHGSASIPFLVWVSIVRCLKFK